MVGRNLAFGSDAQSYTMVVVDGYMKDAQEISHLGSNGILIPPITDTVAVGNGQKEI